MSLKSALGSKLYHARTQRNFTQARVAEAAQISVRWYQQLERGAFLPSAAVLIRLFIFLELDPNDFRKEVDYIDNLPVSSG